VTSATALSYSKGSSDVPKVARELKVNHVPEGSVRKAGGRVRITAQLVDGSSNDHVWPNVTTRPQRHLRAAGRNPAAISKALKLKLLPEEKRHRAARTDQCRGLQFSTSWGGSSTSPARKGDARRAEAIIRLCTRATEIDPACARWALMALGQVILRFALGRGGDDGWWLRDGRSHWTPIWPRLMP